MIPTDNPVIYNSPSLLPNELSGLWPFKWQGLKLLDAGAGILSFELWDAELEGNNIEFLSETGESSVLPIANPETVTDFSFTWDYDGNVHRALTRGNSTEFYFYNSATSAHETMSIAATSAQCALDARRLRLTPPMGVTLAYTHASALWVRFQRERFATAHRICGLPSDARLRLIGALDDRFIFRFYMPVDVLP